MRSAERLGDLEPHTSASATQLRLSVSGIGDDVDTLRSWNAEAEADSASVAPGEEGATASRKDLGAYYTDERVASFLLRWAVSTGRETVLDPSFGGGVFLTAAASRVAVLGGDPRDQIFGVEIDDAAYRTLAGGTAGIGATARLIRASFFDVETRDLPPIDAVVGNPPFIRYHRFKGETRREALGRARQAGVQLSQLTSSWAPFLVHAVQFVKPGGRLAMVVPAELLHARYAKPVLVHLAQRFRAVRVLSFAHRLFPGLSEDTVLLLAAGKDQRPDSFSLVNLRDASVLADYGNPEVDLPSGTGIGDFAVRPTRERAVQYMLPESTRELYQQVKRLPRVRELAELADVGIGYVSGDNDFFHVDRKVATTYGLPDSFLRPAVRRGRDLRGLSFTGADWQRLHDSGDANLLLYPPPGDGLPDSVRAYLAEGVKAGVPERFKCRTRRLWYRVPHVYEADAFLTYMCGAVPRFVANQAGAVAPNTLLVVRFHAIPDLPGLDARSLAASWQTSLTALSAEIEGHSLGGGMLKLEPSEAERLSIALPELGPFPESQELANEVDALMRLGRPELARERVDAVILRDGLGLSQTDIERIREGWLALRARRLNR